MKDRLYFLKELGSNFPEALARINEYEAGLLHCEIGSFRDFVENSMDSGRHWECEKAFQLIEASLTGASPELENAILISLIEDLALGPHTETRHKVIKERAPTLIREKIISVHNFWR